MSGNDSTVILKAPTKTLTGKVEGVNKGGIKIDGQWYNYGRTFRGSKLLREAVGLDVELTLVESKTDGKSYVRSLKVVDLVAAKEEAVMPSDAGHEQPIPQSPDTASTEALKYAVDLALKAGVHSDDLDTMVRVRFHKEFKTLSASEASKLIEFLGGYPRGGRR